MLQRRTTRCRVRCEKEGSLRMLTLHAPAKVNLRLDVIRKRPDGYHDLRMLMVRVGVFDRITLETSDREGVTVLCDDPHVPSGEGNIVWKGATALLGRYGIRQGVRITIEKRIPAAAGLGGGSSDAATVLMGLDRLLNLGCTPEELKEMALPLGADVPFFLFSSPAVAEGVGEILTPAPPIPPCSFVLVNPRIPVPTAWVYRNLQLTERAMEDTFHRSFRSVEELAGFLSNDLEQVTIPAYPVIGEIKDHLRDAGCIGTLMAGSGATVFGLCRSEEDARRVVGRLKFPADWFVSVAPPVTGPS